MQERNGNAHPIAYASRLCTAAEKNYNNMNIDKLMKINTLIVLIQPLTKLTELHY